MNGLGKFWNWITTAGFLLISIFSNSGCSQPKTIRDVPLECRLTEENKIELRLDNMDYIAVSHFAGQTDSVRFQILDDSDKLYCQQTIAGKELEQKTFNPSQEFTSNQFVFVPENYKSRVELFQNDSLIRTIEQKGEKENSCELIIDRNQNWFYLFEGDSLNPFGRLIRNGPVLTGSLIVRDRRQPEKPTACFMGEVLAKPNEDKLTPFVLVIRYYGSRYDKKRKWRMPYFLPYKIWFRGDGKKEFSVGTHATRNARRVRLLKTDKENEKPRGVTHGCVNMLWNDAMFVFSEMEIGDNVYVIDNNKLGYSDKFDHADYIAYQNLIQIASVATAHPERAYFTNEGEKLRKEILIGLEHEIEIVCSENALKELNNQQHLQEHASYGEEGRAALQKIRNNFMRHTLH